MNYDGNTGKVLESWATGTSIKSMASSPDGKAVALGGPKGVIFHPSKSTLDQFAVASMAFSGDGSLLAAAGMDDRIYLWEANTSRLLDKFTGVSDKDRVDRFNANGYKTNSLIRSLALMPDGKTLISAGEDGLVNLWDISGPELSCLLTQGRKEPWWVTFTPDGQTRDCGRRRLRSILGRAKQARTAFPSRPFSSRHSRRRKPRRPFAGQRRFRRNNSALAPAGGSCRTAQEQTNRQPTGPYSRSGSFPRRPHAGVERRRRHRAVVGHGYRRPPPFARQGIPTHFRRRFPPRWQAVGHRRLGNGGQALGR